MDEYRKKTPPMTLTIKDIHLPKDPLATDQEDSDYSSLASERERNKKRLNAMEDPKFIIPQNDATIIGVDMMVDQHCDHIRNNPENPIEEPYSSNGNSWSQGDVDSEYHRFDPGRYPPRKTDNPQESEGINWQVGSLLGSEPPPSLPTAAHIATFEDAMDAWKTRRDLEKSDQTNTLKVNDQSKRRIKKRAPRIEKKFQANESENASNLTQPILKQNRKRQAPRQQQHADVKVDDLEREQLKTAVNRLASQEEQRSALLDQGSIYTEPPLDRFRTVDHSEKSYFESSHHSKPYQTMSKMSKSPHLGYYENEDLAQMGSTIQITGGKKELTPHQRPEKQSFLSFKRPSAPVQIKPKERSNEGTPERILTAFNEKASAYKLGLRNEAEKVATTDTLREQWAKLMQSCKDEWDLTTADLYNPNPSVLYDCYLVNSSHTIAAQLSKIAGRKMRVNLCQGKHFKKIQINVTTVHQSKFRLTKDGNGYGYGTTEKLSREDAFLQTVFETANEDVRERRRLPGQRDTLAALVPPIIKKPPKPITDSLKALHMSCRRGIPIDKNGMPFLVEKDPQNEKYMAYLQKRVTLNKNSTKNMRNNKSLGSQKSMQMRIMLGDQEAQSSIAHMSNMSASQVSLGRSPIYSKHNFKNNEAASKKWIKKVDHLITKFDESFRQNEIQQKEIREAQKELKAAKNKILSKINSAKDENESQDYESNGSYKQDSCMEGSSEDEKLNFVNQTEKTSRQGSAQSKQKEKSTERPKDDQTSVMQKTFQTNQQKEEYIDRLDSVNRKFRSLESKASEARSNQWDTRKELRKMSNQPSKNSKVMNMQNSKKSFRRNRNHDNIILNERSGDLISNASQAQMLTPQDLYKYISNVNISKQAKQVRLPPSYRSTAEKALMIKKTSTPAMNKMTLLELTMSQKRLSNHPIQQNHDIIMTKGESSITMGQQHGSNPKIKYRPAPMQSVTQRQSKKYLDLNSSQRSNFRFDINEAMNRDQSMNKSIMNQLQFQQNKHMHSSVPPPQSKLPKKLQGKEKTKNSDIECFIPSASPVMKRTSPTKQQANNKVTSQLTTSSPKTPRLSIQSSKNFNRDNEAFQTMVGFKKNPEPLLANEKLPKVADGRQKNQSDMKKTMHMTMTELGKKPLTPMHNVEQSHHMDESPKQQRMADSGLQYTHDTKGINPMQTTLNGSENFDLREKANQSGPFDVAGSHNMQIVDEADETETINRPSFFDAIKLKISTKPSPAKTTKNNNNITSTTQQNPFKTTTQGLKFDETVPQKLSKSPSKTLQLSLKDLKEKQLNQVKFPPRKPPVPSFSISPSKKMVSAQITTHTTGFKTTREGVSTSKKITNLKPIDHTNHKKFKPHPKLYEKFRTKIPAKRQLRLASEQPTGSKQDEIVSPYQMMLDEMKNNEKDAEDALRRRIDQMDGGDEYEFQGGEVSIDAQNLTANPEQNNHLSRTYLNMEEKIEKMMQQTNSTAFAGVDHEEMGQTMNSGLGATTRQNFAKMVREENDKQNNDVRKQPYFRNEAPLHSKFTKLLERKFQETDSQFKAEAQKLIEGVKKIEELTRQNKNPMMTQTMSTSSVKNSFKARHQSLNVTHLDQNNQKKGSIKEQLRALKLSEANGGDLSGLSTRQKRKQSHGGVTPTSHYQKKAFDQTGFTSHDQDYKNRSIVINERDPQASLNSPFEEMSSLRSPHLQRLNDTLRDYNPMYKSGMSSLIDTASNMNKTQVSYTFKRFQKDGQKEHTRNILPAVAKLV